MLTSIVPSSMESLQQAAQKRGLHCLSVIWQGRYADYRFRCLAAGHEFVRKGGTVLYTRTTCPECQGQQKLAELRAVAQAKGGDCLESHYLGNAPHRFICAQGHEWQTSPYSVHAGDWCVQCAHQHKRQAYLHPNGLERLQAAAKALGGECLDTLYIGARAKYQFRCGAGHTWHASGSKVLAGVWCKYCADICIGQKRRLKDGLQQLQDAASEKTGQCLSSIYKGVVARYRFRCEAGHEWEASGAGILAGTWCPTCQYDQKRLGLPLMQEIARARGGACLSINYLNSNTSLEWQCQRGHVWSAKPANIRQGKWCPQCAHMAKLSQRKSKARYKYQPSALHRHDSVPV